MKHLKNSIKILAGATLSCFAASAVGFADTGVTEKIAQVKEYSTNHYKNIYTDAKNYSEALESSLVGRIIFTIALLYVVKYFKTMKEQRILKENAVHYYMMQFYSAAEILEKFNLSLDKLKKEYVDIIKNIEEYKKAYEEYKSQNLEKVLNSEDDKVYVKDIIGKPFEEFEKLYNERLKKVFDERKNKPLDKKIKEAKEIESKAKAYKRFIEWREKNIFDQLEDFSKRNIQDEKSQYKQLISKVNELRKLREKDNIPGNIFRKYESSLPKSADELSKIIDDPKVIEATSNLKSYFGLLEKEKVSSSVDYLKKLHEPTDCVILTVRNF